MEASTQLLRGSDVLNHLYQPYGSYLSRPYQAAVAGCTGIGVIGIADIVLKGLESGCNRGYSNYFVDKTINFLDSTTLALIGLISSVATFGYIVFRENQYWNNYNKVLQIIKEHENIISHSTYKRLREELGRYLSSDIEKKFTIPSDDEKARIEEENNKYLNEMLKKILSLNPDFITLYNEAKQKFTERSLYDWFKAKLNYDNTFKIYEFAKTIQNEWLMNACNRYLEQNSIEFLLHERNYNANLIRQQLGLKL